MRKEIIETGKTIEIAIESACLKLGYDRDDVEWEIMDLPKKTFLGLKVIPAKVKVWVEVADEKPVVAPVSSPPQQTYQQNIRQSKPKEAFVAPKNGAKIPAPISAVAPVPTPVQAPTQAPIQPPVKEPFAKAETKIDDQEIEAKVALAVEYLRGICLGMDLNAEFSWQKDEDGVCICLEGEGLGALIGRRGETLDALQYLASLVANRKDGEYVRISVDCGKYRAKRKSTLESLARKLADQVLKTGVSKTLEPMNPSERRIIHAAVGDIKGIASTSVGDEPYRRVVINPHTGRGRTAEPVGKRASDGPPSRDRRPSGPPRKDYNRGPVRHRENTQGGTINTLPQQLPPETIKPSQIQPVQQQPALPVQVQSVQPQTQSPQPQVTAKTTDFKKPLYTKLDLD